MRQVVHVGIMIVVSVGILVGILAAVGFGQTSAALHDAGIGAFAAVGALGLVALLLRAWAWAALNRPVNHRASQETLFKAVVVGMAGNIITPCAFVGGEPLKVLYLAQKKKLPFHEVAGTVLLSKYLEAASFILSFGFTTIVATLSFRDALFGPYLAVGVTLLVFAAAVLVMCAAMMLSLWQRWRPVTQVVKLLEPLPLLRRRLSGLTERTRSMEDQVSRVFCEEGTATWTAFLLLLLVHVTILLKFAFFFHLGATPGDNGMWLGPGELSFLFIVSQAVLALQITPAAAGTLDGGLIGAFALMGYGEQVWVAKCMAFLLCVRFWDAVIVAAGTVFAARAGTKLLAPKPGGFAQPDVAARTDPDTEA